MHKKKIQTLIAAGLLSVGVIGGTLAWFTSEDSVTNKFSTDSEPGINIEEDFKEEEAKNVLPGTEVNKDVQVSNKASYDQFIRVKLDEKFVTVTTSEDGENRDEIKGLDKSLIELIFTTHLEKNLDEATEGDWVLGDDGYYYYIGAVASESWTNTLLDAVNLCKTTAGKDYHGVKFDVDVKAESIQAQNDAVKDWQGIPNDIKGKLVELQPNGSTVLPVAPVDSKAEPGKPSNCKDGHFINYEGCAKNSEHGSSSNSGSEQNPGTEQN